MRNTTLAILPSPQEISHDLKDNQSNKVTLLSRRFSRYQLQISREASGRLRGWITDGKTTEIKLKGLPAYLTLPQATQLLKQSYFKYHKEAIEILPKGLGGMKRTELPEATDEQKEELYGKTLDLTGQDYKTVRLALNKLQSSSTIERLNLSGCNKLENKDLNNVIKMRHLKEIDLSRCNKVSDDILYQLFIENKSIDRLILKENHQITYESIKGICSCFINSIKNLQHAHINLEGCKQLRDEDIINLEGFDLISWVLPSGKYKVAFSTFQNTTFANSGPSILNSGKQVISEQFLHNIDSLIGQIRNHEAKEAVQEAVDELLKNDPEKKVLNLIHKDIGDIGIQAIAAALKVNHTLQSLNIRNRRGNYIGAARISSGGTQALGDALRANYTLQSLTIIGGYLNSIAALALGAAFQVNQTLKSLDLSGNYIRDQGARVFAHVLQVNHTLQSLNLMWNRINKAGIEALGAALAVNQSLQSLNLGGNYLLDHNTNPISSTLYPLRTALQVNHTLQSLHLQYTTPITGEKVQDLGAILQVNHTLQSLDLCGNHIDTAGVQTLGAILQVNYTLQSLNLSQNQIDAEGAQAIGAMLQINQSLQSLDLSNNRIGTEGAQTLGTALQVNHTLQSLNLDYCQIDVKGAHAIGTALQVNHALQTLNLSKNKIGNAGTEFLGATLQFNQSLQSLNISENEIDVEGAHALAIALKVNHTLQSLNLRNNNIGAEGAQLLGAALQVNQALQLLDLRGNQIGATGAQAFGTMLQVNQTLQSLDLCSNKIGTMGAQALGAALEVNHAIQMLNLWYNQIGDEGAQAIGSALKVNQTLQSLNLENNQIGDEGAQALETALKVNYILQELHFNDKCQTSNIGVAIKDRINTLLQVNKHPMLQADKQFAILFQQQITQVQNFLQSHESDEGIVLQDLPQLKELLQKWHTDSKNMIAAMEEILRQSGKTNLNNRYKEKLQDLTHRLHNLWLEPFEGKVTALSNEYVVGKKPSEKRNVKLGYALYETWLTFLGSGCPNWVEDHIQLLMPFGVLLDIAEGERKKDVTELKDPHLLFQRVLSFKKKKKKSKKLASA